jgi:hypothetical protein
VRTRIGAVRRRAGALIAGPVDTNRIGVTLVLLRPAAVGFRRRLTRWALGAQPKAPWVIGGGAPACPSALSPQYLSKRTYSGATGMALAGGVRRALALTQLPIDVGERASDLAALIDAETTIIVRVPSFQALNINDRIAPAS